MKVFNLFVDLSLVLKKPFSPTILSNVSTLKDKICTGALFDGTLKEALEICHGDGKKYCQGIHDRNCDGQVISICADITPANSSDSEIYGCTYIKIGNEIRLGFI